VNGIARTAAIFHTPRSRAIPGVTIGRKDFPLCNVRPPGSVGDKVIEDRISVHLSAASNSNADSGASLA